MKVKAVLRQPGFLAQQVQYTWVVALAAIQNMEDAPSLTLEINCDINDHVTL
jgi:hypothetical protein